MSARPKVLDIRSFREKVEQDWRKNNRPFEIREFTEVCRKRAATPISELLTDAERERLWEKAPELMKLKVKWKSKQG